MHLQKWHLQHAENYDEEYEDRKIRILRGCVLGHGKGKQGTGTAALAEEQQDRLIKKHQDWSGENWRGFAL
jgi:hypothetical protein